MSRRSVMIRVRNKALARCKDVVQDIADEIATSPVTPERTGRLRYSFKAKEDGDSWVLTTNVRYWRFVEFGTEEHGDAQHPIRSAIEVVRASRRAR